MWGVVNCCPDLKEKYPLQKWSHKIIIKWNLLLPLLYWEKFDRFGETRGLLPKLHEATDLHVQSSQQKQICLIVNEEYDTIANKYENNGKNS